MMVPRLLSILARPTDRVLMVCQALPTLDMGLSRQMVVQRGGWQVACGVVHGRWARPDATSALLEHTAHAAVLRCAQPFTLVLLDMSLARSLDVCSRVR